MSTWVSTGVNAGATVQLALLTQPPGVTGEGAKRFARRGGGGGGAFEPPEGRGGGWEKGLKRQSPYIKTVHWLGNWAAKRPRQGWTSAEMPPQGAMVAFIGVGR